MGVDNGSPTSTSKCTPSNSGVEADLSSHCTPTTLSCSGKSHPYLHDGPLRQLQTTHSGTINRIEYAQPLSAGAGGRFVDYSANLDRTGLPLERYAHNQRHCNSHKDGLQDGDSGAASRGQY